MNSKSAATGQQESMEAWAKRMREAPYPGGTTGYMVLDFLATCSLWTALLVGPVMAWIEWRASAKSKVKAADVS